MKNFEVGLANIYSILVKTVCKGVNSSKPKIINAVNDIMARLAALQDLVVDEVEEWPGSSSEKLLMLSDMLELRMAVASYLRFWELFINQFTDSSVSFELTLRAVESCRYVKSKKTQLEVDMFGDTYSRLEHANRLKLKRNFVEDQVKMQEQVQVQVQVQVQNVNSENGRELSTVETKKTELKRGKVKGGRYLFHVENGLQRFKEYEQFVVENSQRLRGALKLASAHYIRDNDEALRLNTEVTVELSALRISKLMNFGALRPELLSSREFEVDRGARRGVLREVLVRVEMAHDRTRRFLQFDRNFRSTREAFAKRVLESDPVCFVCLASVSGHKSLEVSLCAQLCLTVWCCECERRFAQSVDKCRTCYCSFDGASRFAQLMPGREGLDIFMYLNVYQRVGTYINIKN